MKGLVTPLLGTLLFAHSALAQTPAPCESLSKLSLPQAKVLAAETVPAGSFKLPVELPPWMAGAAGIFKSLPAFCRVVVQATPSSDSDIRVEVWLPAENWNGKLQAHGNGGFAGDIDYVHLATSIIDGYASSNTNTGHSTAAGTDASWALGHPEKLTDFGYRAIHVMTTLAKEVIRAHFGKAPQYSYFLGCSNGGRQALMEAQRFPDDYNGILAGAPANYWSHLLTSGLWDTQALTADDASYIPTSKLPAIAHTVNAACDEQDGVSDGILNDPRKCNFKPETMLCKNGDGADCLTRPQIAALKKLYQGPHSSRGKIFPGFLPGAEEGPGGWSTWITGTAPGRSLIAAFTYGYFANIVYGKPDWSFKSASLAEAVKLADERTSRILNATDPNLASFNAHGGKLVLYHGWNDPAISALNTIDYWEAVRAKLGPAQTDSFVRLYMLPGVQHCGGGPGADSFGALNSPGPRDRQHNVQAALELWVEKGVAPSSLTATKYAGFDPASGVKLTRPLCPYPQVAKYRGSGDSYDASNFSCAADPKR